MKIIQLEVIDKEISTILFLALWNNKGISEWCSEVYPYDESLCFYINEQISHGGSLYLKDSICNKAFTLTKENLIEGIKLYIESEDYNITDSIDGQLCINVEYIDECVADFIIQYSIFGMVKYRGDEIFFD